MLSAAHQHPEAASRFHQSPRHCTIEQQNQRQARKIVRPLWHLERGVMVVTAARALEAPKPSPRALLKCARY